MGESQVMAPAEKERALWWIGMVTDRRNKCYRRWEKERILDFSVLSTRILGNEGDDLYLLCSVW